MTTTDGVVRAAVALVTDSGHLLEMDVDRWHADIDGGRWFARAVHP